MNERIKELALQAENYAAEQNDKFGVSYKKTYNQKFAELIVRECANAAYQSLYEDRIFDDNPHIIRTRVMDDIKKHFGIEE